MRPSSSPIRNSRNTTIQATIQHAAAKTERCKKIIQGLDRDEKWDVSRGRSLRACALQCKRRSHWIGGGDRKAVVMKRPEGWLKRLPCSSPDTPFDSAYVECETLAQLADWYENSMASGRRISRDELSFIVEHVSRVRARNKTARSKRAAEKKADEFAEFFYGRDHRNFDAIRARQMVIEEARCDEVPRHTVWTLGSRLWCLRVPKESTATASTYTLKLMELGGQLIRGSLRSTEQAEPLILAFAQGVVLGVSLLAKIDITNALEGLDFWRPCELASIHHVGLDRGQRLRTMDDRDRSR